MDDAKHPYADVGQRISDFRRARERDTGRRIPQREVAKNVGVTVGTVTAWEIGKQRPEGENLVKLATFLRTSPAAIVGEGSSSNAVEVATFPAWLQEAWLADARAAEKRADALIRFADAARLAEENARDRQRWISPDAQVLTIAEEGHLAVDDAERHEATRPADTSPLPAGGHPKRGRAERDAGKGSN